MAGTYTDIIEIVAPDSAAQRERVNVTIRVQNIDRYWDHVIACVAIVDGLRFIDEAAIIPSEKTYSYSGAFLMAGGDVTIYAYSYYPVGADWILDDQTQKDISLAAPPEVYTGTISKKEVEYDGRSAGIPAF